MSMISFSAFFFVNNSKKNKIVKNFGSKMSELHQRIETFKDRPVLIIFCDYLNTGYPMMSKALNATGRPIAYSCSWPAYQGGLPPKVS